MFTNSSIKIRSNVIRLSTLKYLFNFSDQNVSFLISLMLATISAHFILLDLIIVQNAT